MQTESVEHQGARAGRVALRLLGGFEILRGRGEERPQVPLPAQRLVALLALHGEVGRSYAAGILWPEIEHSHALANLRTALWRLRTLVPGIVRSTGAGLRADPETRLDLRESESLANRILHGDLPLAQARVASEQFCHDLLPDWDDDWLAFDRERFRDLRIRALERLCDRLSALGEHAEAVQCGLLAVEGEPLRESSHRALMRAHVAEGNRARALQTFRMLERELELELQVAPSQATIDLAHELVGPVDMANTMTRRISASG
jgi:DNA-binding SARP family transcriptional activator